MVVPKPGSHSSHLTENLQEWPAESGLFNELLWLLLVQLALILLEMKGYRLRVTELLIAGRGNFMNGRSVCKEGDRKVNRWRQRCIGNKLCESRRS
jgi:hypothetical protein